MYKKAILIGGALASLALLPGIASASFVLDTGTPSDPTLAPVILNSTSWVAGEFSLGAESNITSLAAYLAPGGSGRGGTPTYTFDIYSGSPFLDTQKSTLVPLQSFSATFSGTGWNTTNTNFDLAGGTYWLALQMSTTGTLDLPQESPLSTGTAPALGFATLSTNTAGKFTQTGALPVGLEVTASPVPLPAGIWLLGSGLLSLGAFARRRLFS